MKRILHVCVLLFLLLLSCKEENAKEVELVYKYGNQKIEVEIENGQDFLEYNKPTKTNFIFTNIDPYTASVVGLGIRILGTKDKTTLRTEINVPSNYLEKDTLDIKVLFGVEKKIHEFHIPLKSLK